MKKREEQRCGNCDAWMPVDAQGGGLCRARPPLPVFIGMGQSGSVIRAPEAPRGAEPVFVSQFPQMKAHGWCREWADKELVDQQRH